MGKLRRRAELQHKYNGVLQWGIPRDVSIRISDYQRQDTILQWIVDNFNFFCDVPSPSIWLDFLDNSERAHDTPIEELLEAFMEDYPRLCEIKKLTIDLLIMGWHVEEFLVEPSLLPRTGLGEYVKRYATKETRLATLVKVQSSCQKARNDKCGTT